MKRVRLLFLLVSLSLSANLSAAPFDMILTGDPVLEDIRFLSLTSGRTFLSFTPPLAPAVVENFLDSIDPSLLPEPAQQAYDRIRDRLIPQAAFSFESDNLSVLLDINATLEGRARFNNDISWYPAHPDISPLLSLPLRFHFGNTVQLYIDPSVSMMHGSFSPADSGFAHNVPQGYGTYDSDMPFRAFIAAGGPWWNFQLGRDRLFWGTGHTGSLSFSDNADFFEFARVSFFSRFLKYSVVVNQMPLRITDSLYSGPRDPEYPDSFPWRNPDSLRRTTQRHFYMHRLDVSLFRDRLSIGLMEGVMVGDSPLEIRFLNPMMIFHSLFAWRDYYGWGEGPPGSSTTDMVGSFFSAEVNWHITSALSFHGQMVMNEFATSGELRHNPEQPPNALGYMAGLTFARSFNTWGSVFFLEFIYTDPYLYMMSTPFASFIHMRRPGLARYYLIGHSRDTISVTLGGRFFNSNTLNLTGVFSWVASGELNKGGLTWNWTDDPASGAFDRRTLDGIAEYKFIATLGAEWRLMPRLGLSSSVTGIVARNNNHVQSSNALGGQMSFAVSWRH
ncbi:MAG: capsule assembly Wzi family protein [Treponema sp.]|nr:capsule assembly Wzi family protein [Treponema sp.]